MGSGKTAAAGLLSSKLEIPFVDLDQEIEKEISENISEIFSKKGEIFFRKAENKVLKRLLETKKKQIIALGGGTPCYANNLSLIRQQPNTKLVYLKVSLDELTKRLFTEKEKRPLLQNLNTKAQLKDFIRKHLFERTHYYQQSDIIIDGDLSTERVVAELLEELKK